MYLDTRQSISHRLNHQVLQATVLQLFYQAVACSRTNVMMLFMTSKVRSIQVPTNPHPRTAVCVRLVLFLTVLAQPYFKTILRKINR